MIGFETYSPKRSPRTKCGVCKHKLKEGDPVLVVVVEGAVYSKALQSIHLTCVFEKTNAFIDNQKLKIRDEFERIREELAKVCPS